MESQSGLREPHVHGPADDADFSRRIPIRSAPHGDWLDLSLVGRRPFEILPLWKKITKKSYHTAARRACVKNSHFSGGAHRVTDFTETCTTTMVSNLCGWIRVVSKLFRRAPPVGTLERQRTGSPGNKSNKRTPWASHSNSQKQDKINPKNLTAESSLGLSVKTKSEKTKNLKKTENLPNIPVVFF